MSFLTRRLFLTAMARMRNFGKQLPANVDEFEFRFNNRHNECLSRDTLRALVGAETLRYQELIAATALAVSHRRQMARPQH